MSDAQAPARGDVPVEERSSCRWVRGAGTLWRNAGETVVLLPPAEESRTPLVVSGSAALLWELLADPITLSELGAQLAAVYGARAPLIEKELEPVLERLHTAGAVERLP